MLTLGGERFKEQLQLESVEDVKTVCDAAGLEFVHLPDGGFDVLKPNRKVCPYHTYPPPPPSLPHYLPIILGSWCNLDSGSLPGGSFDVLKPSRKSSTLLVDPRSVLPCLSSISIGSGTWIHSHDADSRVNPKLVPGWSA